MKSNSLKPIKVGYGEDYFVFFLRMISVAEEETFTQKFANISEADENKHQKRFEIYREALGQFSIQMPSCFSDGKESPLAKDDKTPFDAIQNHFKDRSPENERILQYTYIMFRNQLEPSASFL